MVKFELGNVVTEWCKSKSGVRQGCPLSPLRFNFYIRELGMRIEECQEGFKYPSVNSNGELKRSHLDGLMYADDVCLFAECVKVLQRVCDHGSTVIEEYGLKVSEMKSKVVCINGILAVKFAASRSGSRFVISRACWKGLVVNKLMYGCGSLLWSQTE